RHDLTLCDGSGERPFLRLVLAAILRMKSAVLPVFGGRGAQNYRASPDLLRLPVGKEQLSARSFTDDDASWHPIQNRLQPAALRLGMSLANLCRSASCLGVRLLRLDGRLPIESDGELVDNGVDENEIELVQAGRRFELKSAKDRAMADDERKQDEARRVLRLDPHVVAERTGKRSSRDSVQVNAGTYE